MLVTGEQSEEAEEQPVQAVSSSCVQAPASMAHELQNTRGLDRMKRLSFFFTLVLGSHFLPLEVCDYKV